jgi:hypothetical protein
MREPPGRHGPVMEDEIACVTTPDDQLRAAARGGRAALAGTGLARL